jgi:citrate lyase subunit beta / citryl-CoA lyase
MKTLEAMKLGTRPLRSYLFAPGNHPRKVEKVFQVGADAIILDLEDAVAVSEKEATRKTVVEAMKKPRNCLGYIRVNDLNTEFSLGDFQAVVGDWLDGVVIPKVEKPGDLQTADWILTGLEKERGLETGSIDLLPIIETGLGIQNIEEIANSGTRVKRLSFGAGDFTRDMGMIWSPNEEELSYARSRMVLASRNANIESPIDTVFIDLEDEEHLQKSAQTAAYFGFQGKLCIHPKQIAAVHGAFTPTAKQIKRAQKIVQAFKEAEEEGSASIQVDGYFVDYPIVEKAMRVLEIAKSIPD